MFYVDCIHGASPDPPGDVDGGGFSLLGESKEEEPTWSPLVAILNTTFKI